MTKWEQLRNLTRTAIENAHPCLKGTYQPTKSVFVTMTTKDLKPILLETGGEFETIVKGVVQKCFIKKKSLGLGVYNVWAETRVEGRL